MNSLSTTTPVISKEIQTAATGAPEATEDTTPTSTKTSEFIGDTLYEEYGFTIGSVNYPNRIDEILPRLWIGDVTAARSPMALENRGIKYVLSIMDLDEAPTLTVSHKNTTPPSSMLILKYKGLSSGCDADDCRPG